MYEKVSNTATIDELNNTYNLPFKYPKIYQPSKIINGMAESSLPVITAENSDIIDYGIWGMLPESYKEDWDDFQHASNTLTVNKNILEEDIWIADSLRQRRCMILVTGFFTSYLKNGVLYPFYVHEENYKPFSIAGLYNVLDDGFITMSMLLKSADDFINRIENISNVMPCIIDQHQYDSWLNGKNNKRDLLNILRDDYTISLSAHPIAREFFKNNILYDSILEPVAYRDLPLNANPPH